MKFIDEAKIFVKAGHGGKGCVSFRREKYVPKGGPDGGNGGKGGDVVIIASATHQTLLDLKYRQHHVAKHGGHGEGGNRTGKDSDNVEVVVPVGTVVKDVGTGELLADLISDGERFIVAKGGIGGKGNAHFASATNRAPRYAQDGMPGEERWVNLELKLLADVGIIGLPNVGKSTFISKVSAAKPKIADYPFTTLKPNLGVVRIDNEQTFVVADIPGLIKGAHQGAGMGTQFLRHIERTSLLFHILDISQEDERDAWDDYETVNRELALFGPALLAKPQIVGIGKTDLPNTRERVKEVTKTFKKKGIKVHAFSAATGAGVSDVIKEMARLLQQNRVVIRDHEYD